LSAAIASVVGVLFGPDERPGVIGGLTTLELIAAMPATRAADLAAALGRETAPFKLDVRKLKNLGLTYSLDVGYRLTTRGAGYLRWLS